MIPAMTLWFLLEAPLPPPELTPEARAHNDRGVALVLAGQFDEGIAELERAYAALPDPLLQRAGRGKVLGSLRSALVRRYEATGASVHLCRLREILQRHRTELLTALGPTGGADDVAGTDEAIVDVDAKLAGRPCDAVAPGVPSPPPEPRPVVSAPSQPPPLHPPGDASPRSNRLRGAGWGLIGVGGLAAIGSATAAAIHGDRYRRLDALDRWLETPAEIAAVQQLYHDARLARTAAIVTGSVGGALLVAGIAVLVNSPRRARRLSLAPALTPGAWGLHVHGRF